MRKVLGWKVDAQTSGQPCLQPRTGRGRAASQGRRKESGCWAMETTVERAAECSRDDGGQARLGKRDGSWAKSSQMIHSDAINKPAG